MDADQLLRDDTEYTKRCLFLGNLDYNLYSKDENVSETVREIWRQYGGQLKAMHKEPVISHLSLRTCH